MRKLAAISLVLSVWLPVCADRDQTDTTASDQLPRRRYKLTRTSGSDELTIEPVGAGAAPPKYRVSCPDGDEDDDCGCHGDSKGSLFGR